MVNTTTVKIGKAAQILGVSIDTVRRWTKSGKLPSARTFGGTRLYQVSDLENFHLPEKVAVPFVPSPAPHVWFGRANAETHETRSLVTTPNGRTLRRVFWGIGLAVSFGLLLVAIVVLWPRFQNSFSGWSSQTSISVADWRSERFGSAKIPAGQVAVVVFTQAATGAAKILVTPTSLIDQPLAVVSKGSGRFIVAVKTVEKEEINFDWLIQD